MARDIHEGLAMHCWNLVLRRSQILIRQHIPNTSHTFVHMAHSVIKPLHCIQPAFDPQNHDTIHIVGSLSIQSYPIICISLYIHPQDIPIYISIFPSLTTGCAGEASHDDPLGCCLPPSWWEGGGTRRGMDRAWAHCQVEILQHMSSMHATFFRYLEILYVACWVFSVYL